MTMLIDPPGSFAPLEELYQFLEDAELWTPKQKADPLAQRAIQGVRETLERRRKNPLPGDWC